MSSHLAWSGTTRWAGISPSAGHEYAVNAERPLPVYIHHCAADSMVRIDGCCAADGGPTCCCGIGAQRKTCVSTATLFEQWLNSNRCTGREAALAGPAGAQCTTGTGCVANATFCVHEGCFHQQWSRSFPAADAVVEFFARHACELRGAWRVAREGAPPRCARARASSPRSRCPRSLTFLSPASPSQVSMPWCCCRNATRPWPSLLDRQWLPWRAGDGVVVYGDKFQVSHRCVRLTCVRDQRSDACDQITGYDRA